MIIIICREFWSINNFTLQNWGACVDTVFGMGQVNEAWIGIWRSNDWPMRKLPMTYNTDDKTTGGKYGSVREQWLIGADGRC